jgi:hypothetical protein
LPIAIIIGDGDVILFKQVNNKKIDLVWNVGVIFPEVIRIGTFSPGFWCA